MKMSNRIMWAAAAALFASVIVMLMFVKFSTDSVDRELLRTILPAQHNAAEQIRGNGRIVTKTKQLADFNTIVVAGKYELTVKPGNKPDIVLRIDENLVPYMNINVTDQALHIASKEQVSLVPSQRLQATVTAQPLHAITLAGDSVFKANDLNTDRLHVISGGESNIQLQGHIKHLFITLGGKSEIHANKIQGEKIDINAFGKATVYLSGKVKDLVINTGGSTTVFAQNLITENVTIIGAGKSDITVHASKSLSVTMAGEGQVKYYGDPKNVSKTGLGKLRMIRE